MKVIQVKRQNAIKTSRNTNPFETLRNASVAGRGECGQTIFQGASSHGGFTHAV
jgi:hypothetical protein